MIIHWILLLPHSVLQNFLALVNCLFRCILNALHWQILPQTTWSISDKPKYQKWPPRSGYSIETLFIPVSSGFQSSSCYTNVNHILSLPQLFEDHGVKKLSHYHYSIVASAGSVCLIVKWNKDYHGIKRHLCDNI